MSWNYIITKESHKDVKPLRIIVTLKSFKQIPWLFLKDCDLKKSNINLSSWKYLSLTFNTSQAVMDKLYTTDIVFRTLQALVVQQLKFTKSLLLLSKNHVLTSQSSIMKMIFEINITIAWLLVNIKRNKLS